MASKKTLNAKNLAALGADRLAALLMEVTKGNATAKRRLRLELAGEHRPADLAREIARRLDSIARSDSFIDWHGRKQLLADLEMQRRAIVDRVAQVDPAAAFDLIWRLLSLTNGLYERCDDSSGRLQDFFHSMGPDVSALARLASPAPNDLADRLADRLPEDEWGHFSDLIPDLTECLGSEGLDRLKAALAERARTGPGRYAVRHALERIADVEGDVDAFIAQQSEASRKLPAIAAEIAARLLEHDRVDEAWRAIDAVDETRPGWIPFEWEDIRAKVLEAQGHQSEANRFRWDCFSRSLNADHLRSILKTLPDFEDIETEEKAMAVALAHENVHRALHFLLSWPALGEAAQLVTSRSSELDGTYYELLTPAAELLEDRYPVAATLVLRSLIDFALEKGRVKRYRHAARHLHTCEALSHRIKDFAPMPDHDSYTSELRQKHKRKSSFWAEV